MKRFRCLISFALIFWTGCTANKHELTETTVTPIGAEGGIAHSAEGLFELTIPAGRLQADTSITIHTVRTSAVPGVVSYTYELGPKDFVFERSVMATLHIDTTEHVVLAEHADATPLALNGSVQDRAHAVVRAPLWRLSTLAALSDGAPAPDPVTIEGRTLFADAVVTADVGGAPFQANADANGAYSVQVDLPDPDALVILRARGIAQHSEDSLELASIIGPASDVLARAGSDLVLDESEDANVVVTTLTTAWYAGVFAEHGSLAPLTGAELEQAEATIQDSLRTDELYLTSAFLRRQISGALLLDPAYATTLAYVEDIAALWSAIDQEPQEFTQENVVSAVRPAPDARELSAAFTAAELDVHYQGLTPMLRDSVRAFGTTRWAFAANGAGIYQPQTYWIDPLASFTWSIGQEGVTVDFAQPMLLLSWYMDAQAIIDLVHPDAALEAAIRAELPPPNTVLVHVEKTGVVLQLLRRAPAFDWVLQRTRVRWRFDEVLTQAAVPAFDVLQDGLTTSWRRPSSLAVDPFSESELLGDWVLDTVHAAPFGAFTTNAGVGPHVVGAPMLGPEVVTLSAGGVATSGTRSWSWQLEADGTFTFTYPDGAQQSYSRLGTSGAYQGLLTFYRPSATEEYASYFTATRVDPNFVPSASTLASGANQYWVSTIGEAARESFLNGLGYGLRANGEAFRFIDSQYEENLTWTLDGGVVSIRRGFSTSGRGRCTTSDPSCVSEEQRRWQPIALDGDLLIVIEDDLRLNSTQLHSATFDQSSGSWIGLDGNPVDVNDLGYFVWPRVNAYRVAPMP